MEIIMQPVLSKNPCWRIHTRTSKNKTTEKREAIAANSISCTNQPRLLDAIPYYQVSAKIHIAVSTLMILIVLLPILGAVTWAFINIRGAALRQQGLGLVSKDKA